MKKQRSLKLVTRFTKSRHQAFQNIPNLPTNACIKTNDKLQSAAPPATGERVGDVFVCKANIHHNPTRCGKMFLTWAQHVARTGCDRRPRINLEVCWGPPRKDFYRITPVSALTGPLLGDQTRFPYNKTPDFKAEHQRITKQCTQKSRRNAENPDWSMTADHKNQNISKLSTWILDDPWPCNPPLEADLQLLAMRSHHGGSAMSDNGDPALSADQLTPDGSPIFVDDRWTLVLFF